METPGESGYEQREERQHRSASSSHGKAHRRDHRSHRNHHHGNERRSRSHSPRDRGEPRSDKKAEERSQRPLANQEEHHLARDSSNRSRAEALRKELSQGILATASGTSSKAHEPLIALDARNQPYHFTESEHAADDSSPTQDVGKDLSVAELLRQEKLKGGMHSAFRDDMDMAARIARDSRFQNDADYMDDNLDALNKKVKRPSDKHRKFVAQDYLKTQRAIERCRYCWLEGRQPALSVVATGLSCYLALPERSELLQGHCLIVPMQHYASCLEGDDDVWEEIRNFQKSLMRMFADQGLGVVFCETVLDPGKFKHSFIEAFPLPWDLSKDAKAYFREALLTTGEEWSQHKKIIDTSQRGIRRTLIPDLPYFHVWFGLNEGMGHVIEQPENSASFHGASRSRRPGEDDEALIGYDLDDGNRQFDGGVFRQHFAQQVIADMLKLDSQRWRRPSRVDDRENSKRLARFKKLWLPWDWTRELEKS